MILDDLTNADRYLDNHPLFGKAFEFLRRPDIASLPDGRHDIDGDRLYAIVMHAPGKGRANAPLEAHRKYIDIQYVVSDRDEMGWQALQKCSAVRDPYDAGRDVEFFTDEPVAWVNVPQGCLAIFFPHDAHAPLGAEGTIHKVVVKVLCEPLP